MNSLYQAMLNLSSVGLFHLIEQQLAELTYDASMETAVADTKLTTVREYYRDGLNLDLRQFPAWDVIEELRLVANTAKHAEGGSAEELRKKRPDLFHHPATRNGKQSLFPEFHPQLPLGGQGLYVTTEDSHRYENAANDFLQFVFQHFNNNPDVAFPT